LAEEEFVRDLAAKRVRYIPDIPEVTAFWKKLTGKGSGKRPILFPQVHWEESWIEFYIGAVRHIHRIQVQPKNTGQAQSAQSTQGDAGQSNETGWQAIRVEKKLNILENEGVVLENHAPVELRRMVEGRFDAERRETHGAPPPAPPSRRVINRVIKNRLARRVINRVIKNRLDPQ
jgi:hypothetical protein